MRTHVKLGIDRFLEKPSDLKEKRVGLLINASGVDSNLNADVDLLMDNGFNVVKLFGPEHGIFGAAEDGKKVSNTVDKRYNIPIFSLYGETTRPTAEMLEGVDAVVYDIQDVGLRFYTYIYTLAYMMEECGKRGIKVVVLDRPNPLSGEVEGPVIKKEFESFVGGYGLTLRYGLTPGELALYFNNQFNMNVDLEIVKMENWHRWMYYDDGDLLWNTPSPNLPSFEHTLLYIGMCLLEGTNVSEGRGTVHPFKYIGAPWINSKKLKDEMEKIAHPGVVFRERDFMPLSSKYANELCHGLEFFVVDKKSMKPIELALNLISILRKDHPKEFEWNVSYPGTNAKGRYHFDLLMGDESCRLAIDGEKNCQGLSEAWRKEEKSFENSAKKYRLYD